MTDDTKDKNDKAKKTDFEKYIEVLDAGKAKADDRHRSASEVKRIYQQLQIAHNHALADVKRFRAEANQLADDKHTAERLQAHAVSELARADARIEELIGQPAKLQGKLDRATALIATQKRALRLEDDSAPKDKPASPNRTIIATPAYKIWRTNLKADTIVFAKVDVFWFTFNGNEDKLHEIMPELDVVVAVVGEDQRTTCIRFPAADQERITARVANTGTAMAWVEKVGEEPVKLEDKPEIEELVESGQGMRYAQLAQRLGLERETYYPFIDEARNKAGDKPLTENQWRGLHASITGHVASSLRETVNYVATKEWKGGAVTILGGKYTLKGNLPKTGTWAIELTRTGETKPSMGAGTVGPDGKWLATYALEKEINGFVKALAEPKTEKPDPKAPAPTATANGKESESTNSSPSGDSSSVEPAPQDGAGKSTPRGEVKRVGPEAASGSAP